MWLGSEVRLLKWRKCRGKSQAPRNRNQPVTLTEDEVEIFLVVSFLPSVGFMLCLYGILPQSLLRRLALLQGLDLLFSFGETCHEPQIFKIHLWQTWVHADVSSRGLVSVMVLRWTVPSQEWNLVGVFILNVVFTWVSRFFSTVPWETGSKLHSSTIVGYGCNFVLPNLGRNEA